MNQKYLVSIGYIKLAFDDKETAMRLYAHLLDSVPVAPVYCYGADMKAPESLKGVSYVREDSNAEIKLERVDASQFAIHLTQDEYRQKCKVQPTEVDVEAILVEEAPAMVALEAPDSEPF
jgi:hypothetical protein